MLSKLENNYYCRKMAEILAQVTNFKRVHNCRHHLHLKSVTMRIVRRMGLLILKKPKRNCLLLLQLNQRLEKRKKEKNLETDCLRKTFGLFTDLKRYLVQAISVLQGWHPSLLIRVSSLPLSRFLGSELNKILTYLSKSLVSYCL